jgi:hypothetical protein
MKNFQAKGEAPALKQEHMTIQTKHFFTFCLLFGVILNHLDLDRDPADQNQCGSMRIRIQIHKTKSFSRKLLNTEGG